MPSGEKNVPVSGEGSVNRRIPRCDTFEGVKALSRYIAFLLGEGLQSEKLPATHATIARRQIHKVVLMFPRLDLS